MSSHPENVATEALGYILRRPAAQQAAAALFRDAGLPDQDELTFQTQAHDEVGGRPDLAGRAPDGTLRVLIEAKFWAGLTDNQPVGYLAQLPPDKCSLLLFVAPARRFETLWSEISRRACPDGSRGAESRLRSTLRSQEIGKHYLALTSWTDLLSHILQATDAVGDGEASADVRQLLALCERMDTDAFLPLTSDELTSSLGRRVFQFGDLADDLASRLIERGLADAKGLRATGGNGYYGRYLRLRNYGAFLHFNARRWAEFGESPLWLQLGDEKWKFSPKISQSLTQAGIRSYESSEGALIPILLPFGVERDLVVRHAIDQIDRILACLPLVDPPLFPEEPKVEGTPV